MNSWSSINLLTHCYAWPSISFFSMYYYQTEKQWRKNAVPLAGGVNGVGGVGYGASGTGIVKLTEVVLSWILKSLLLQKLLTEQLLPSLLSPEKNMENYTWLS